MNPSFISVRQFIALQHSNALGNKVTEWDIFNAIIIENMEI